MASKSVTLRQQANISRWIQEVQSCCNRPAEMTVQDWCDEHGIKSSTYYQHYLKVKDLCVEQMKTQRAKFSGRCEQLVKGAFENAAKGN